MTSAEEEWRKSQALGTRLARQRMLITAVSVLLVMAGLAGSGFFLSVAPQFRFWVHSLPALAGISAGLTLRRLLTPRGQFDA
jgi:hypothetical protein